MTGMKEKPPTLYRSVALHLADCSAHLDEQPGWLRDSLDRLGDAFNAYGAAQAANVDRDAVGRKQSDKRPEVRRRLLDGQSIYRIRKDLGVGASMVESVAAEIAAKTPAKKVPTVKPAKATVTPSKKPKKRDK